MKAGIVAAAAMAAMAFASAGMPAYAQDASTPASEPVPAPATPPAPAPPADDAASEGTPPVPAPPADDAASEAVQPVPADDADPEDAPPAPPAWHFWMAAGGVLPIFGPEPGLWAGAALSRGRWGVRTDGFVFGRGDEAELLAAGNVTYELGRTRRHLVMTARGGAGVRLPDAVPVLMVGISTQLGLMKRGPLVLALDVGFHVDLGDLPLDTYLVSMLGLGLSW